MSDQRLELRTKMAALQKEYSAVAAELKALDDAAKKAANREKYREYLFKVGVQDNTLFGEENIQEVTDEDRENIVVGNSGLVYTQPETQSRYAQIMMKSREEYNKYKIFFQRIEAARVFLDDKNKSNKAKEFAILVGETESQAEQTGV